VKLSNYEEFFATAHETEPLRPFPYQVKFATAPELPLLLNVPTGTGKTATIVLGWLWRRRFASAEVQRSTPRRLAYCLPMRVLVEQTVSHCQDWVRRLGLEDIPGAGVAVYSMLGGQFDDNWDLFPEQDAILIGTQDMLLSRALNRGYGSSRYRWPTQFGLLNSDTLWVFDETQLMGVGVKTSAQLQAFRQRAGAAFPARSIWMSATLDEATLETVDTRGYLPQPWEKLGLGQDDYANPQLAARFSAKKSLHKAELTLMSDTRNDYARKLAELISDVNEKRGGQTIVVLNRVDRAQETFRALQKISPGTDTLLIHSRFRGKERQQLSNQLRQPIEPGQNRIIIATQAIEAGVDISSRTLITELAPWDSLVQRFGRCNRYGEEEDAHVIWVDIQSADEKGKQTKDVLPYTDVQLDAARALLLESEDAGPQGVSGKCDGLPEPVFNVIRHRDLMDLFDTTPDLAGADVDVSRFIRDSDNLDVQVYWRDLSGKEPSPELESPGRNELCAIGVSAFREFAKKKQKDGALLWVWDNLDGGWLRLLVEQVRPGMVILADNRAGGYDLQLGWFTSSSKVVDPVESEATDANQANADDPLSHIGRFVTLHQHHDDVVAELGDIVGSLSLSPEETSLLERAARLHDWGKAHPLFQEMLTERKEGEPPVEGSGPWAKSDRLKFNRSKDLRPQFRHELASALAALSVGEDDLVCYLIAAHHGKVRLSIRSMPNEKVPKDGSRFARGIWEGDRLPAVKLGDGIFMPEITLNLQPMELGRGDDGQPSWLERMLKLRDGLGPFRLAYLEAIIRAADRRASAKEAQQ
jgi:CRISPR-associated endonuclease/helicase Cas3